MKELFRLLDEREKKQLQVLSLLLLVALVLLIYVLFGQRQSYNNMAGELIVREKAAREAKIRRAATAAESIRWETSYKDIEKLKRSYFYQEADGINALRLDLQKIFAQSGISSRAYKYDYSSLEKDKVKKVDVTFNFTGSYPILKKFLMTLEKFPRFILLEKIDFVKISVDGNLLDLKIILACYYANS
jgi:Tfp pilus assembly protein PilO